MVMQRGPVGGVHHVMNRGVDRQRIFFSDADRIEFGARLAAIHELFGVETLAYCLMDNHFHLLLHDPEGRLSSAMQHLGSVFVRRTNDRVGRDGPMFRSRFHSIPVTTDSYLATAARYIHRNPLGVAGVTTPSAYRWSSYRTYLGHRPTPPFLRTDLLLSGGIDQIAELVEFTEGSRRTEIQSFDDLRQNIAFEIARHDIVHGVDDPGSTSQVPRERVLVVLLRDHLPISVAAEVDRYLAFPTADARRMAMSRARRQHRNNPVVAALVERLLATIHQLAAA